MRLSAKTALGIDIGKRRISAALVERTERGFRVLAANHDELPEGASESAHSARAATLSRVVRKLGRQARARGLRSVVAVSEDSTVLRLLDLPRQMPSNIGDFVDNELKQYVALSGRRTVSDFCGVGTSSDLRKRLLAAAADASDTAEIITACCAAGLAVHSVEPAALAAIRASFVAEKSIRHASHAMIATLDSHALSVSLFAKGTLDFVRMREVPPGLETPESLSGWLRQELDTVLRCGREEASDETADWQVRLILHDPARSRDEMARLVTLETAVKSLTVEDSCGQAFGSRDATDGTPPVSSLIAVGAAMKLLNVEGDDLRISLTPEEVRQARSIRRHVLVTANVAALVFVGVLLGVEVLASTGRTINRRIAERRIAEQLPTMPALVTEDRYLDSEISQIQRELASLKPVHTRRDVDLPTVLDTIRRMTPEGVSVTHLTCEDDEILSIKGLAPSPRKAQAFVLSLHDERLFASARLTRMQRPHAHADLVEYEIDCTLRPMNRESDGNDRS